MAEKQSGKTELVAFLTVERKEEEEGFIGAQSVAGRGTILRDLRDGCQALSEDGRRARRRLQPITASGLRRLLAVALSSGHRVKG